MNVEGQSNQLEVGSGQERVTKLGDYDLKILFIYMKMSQGNTLYIVSVHQLKLLPSNGEIQSLWKNLPIGFPLQTKKF